MRKRMRWLSAALLLAAAGMGSAMFINNSVQVPVDRVVANVEAWIKEKPADAQAYYVLGRIHAMAWAYGPELNLWAPAGRGRGAGRGAAPPAGDPFSGALPGFAPYDSVQVRRAGDKKNVTAADARHLAESIRNYSKAAELDTNKSIYELGLAWIMQETGKVARSLPEGFAETDAKVTDAERAGYEAAIRKLGADDARARDEASRTLAAAMPKSYAALRRIKSDDAEVNARVDALLKGYWDLQALEHYRKAYALDLQADLNGRGPRLGADRQVSAEAGDGILAILKAHPTAAKAGEEAEVAANIKIMRSRPLAVTPIVLAMTEDAPPEAVTELLDPAKRVTFDLAGDGVARQWPWVKPGTALLVWDPARTGAITSGRALFGSATWWIAFRDGYEALSVLDDNRDGYLTGAELEGISVWIDRDGDGVAEPGEVLTLAQAGIVRIAVHAKRGADGVLVSVDGVMLHDGRTVRTFDWVAEPAAEISHGR